MSGALWTVFGVVAAAGVLWITKYAIKAIATQVVFQIGDSLQDRWQKDIDDAIIPVLEELSYNGGQSVKDMVRQINRDIETLLHETP